MCFNSQIIYNHSKIILTEGIHDAMLPIKCYFDKCTGSNVDLDCDFLEWKRDCTTNINNVEQMQLDFQIPMNSTKS